MLITHHRLDDSARTSRRQWFDATTVVIGRDAACDLVLDDPDVAPKHLQLALRGRAIFIENLALDAVTVNGSPLHQHRPQRLAERWTVRIGATEIRVRRHQEAVVTTQPVPPQSPPYANYNPPPPQPPPPPARRPPARLRLPPRRPEPPLDPIERPFFENLREQPGDDATRLVYADWLEQRGDAAKAALVRGHDQSEAWTWSDADWRAVCVRAQIEHCTRPECPAWWDRLIPDAVTDYARRCATCDQRVIYCVALRDVRAAAFVEAPIVHDATLDPSNVRASYANPTAVIERDDIHPEPDDPPADPTGEFPVRDDIPPEPDDPPADPTDELPCHRVIGPAVVGP